VRWALFAVVAAMSWTARVLGGGSVIDPAGSALLSAGCLILGGALAGELARRWRLPRISGYLVLGLLVGPYALGFETHDDARFLTLFEEVALGLIALTAGGEFRVQDIRQRVRPLLAITTVHVVGIFAVVGGLTWLAQAATAALLLGVIAVAVSPATTIAVITELRGRGEVTETVLGVTILKDLAILLLFTMVSSSALSLSAGAPLDWSVAAGAVLEIGASLAVGLVLGLLFGLYVVKVGRHLPLLVVLLALVSVELGSGTAVEHLLVCMAAGFVIRNLFPHGAGPFLDALERASPPIYILFFGLVGAGLDLGTLRLVWLPALGFVLLRLIAVWALTRAPARIAGSGDAVVRYAWMGFVAQAGLSLGLAARIQRELPEFGPAVATLVVAAVVVNQLVGPVLWKHALEASGEVSGEAGTARAAHSSGSRIIGTREG
jgi:Kef-type K+ transport system membrane component KefB